LDLGGVKNWTDGTFSLPAVGNELEYTDELTLGRSILDRRPFDS
ncbi:MAG: hypothetical protein ACI391_01585, partial [Muribaculaceae bacterium]